MLFKTYIKVGLISNLSEKFAEMAVIWLQSNQKGTILLKRREDFYGDIPSLQLKRNYFFRVAMAKLAHAGSRFYEYLRH